MVENKLDELNRNLTGFAKRLELFYRGVIPALGGLQRSITSAINDNSKVTQALVLSNRSTRADLKIFVEGLRTSYLTVSESAKVYAQATDVGLAKSLEALAETGERFTLLGRDMGAGFALIRMNNQLLGAGVKSSANFVESLITNAVQQGQSSDNLIAALNSLRSTIKVLSVDFGKDFASETQRTLARLILTAGQEFTGEANNLVRMLLEGSQGFIARQFLGVQEGSNPTQAILKAVESLNKLQRQVPEGPSRTFFREALAADLGIPVESFVLAQRLAEETNGDLKLLIENNAAQLALQQTQADLSKDLKTITEGIKAEILPLVAGTARFLRNNMGWLKPIAKGMFLVVTFLSTTLLPYLAVSRTKEVAILGWNRALDYWRNTLIQGGKNLIQAYQSKNLLASLVGAENRHHMANMGRMRVFGGLLKSIGMGLLRLLPLVGLVTTGFFLVKSLVGMGQETKKIQQETLDIQKKQLSLQEARSADNRGLQVLQQMKAQNAQMIANLNTLSMMQKRANEYHAKTVSQGDRANNLAEEALQQQVVIPFEDTGV